MAHTDEQVNSSTSRKGICRWLCVLDQRFLPLLDCFVRQSHAWVAMEIETKFLRLCNPAALGDRIDGWRVCWIGGWDKCRVFFFVMVERPHPGRSIRSARCSQNA
jgi:hypothetical protein